VLRTVDHLEISYMGAPPFSWLEKPKHRMGRQLVCIAHALMVFQ